MRRAVGALLVMASLGSIVFTAPPSSAASAIQIRLIYYNPPGTDYRSNTYYNKEYISFRNVTTATHSMTGWTIRDAQGHVYKFGTTSMAAGVTVYLHTGKGTNTATNRYWGQSAYIWNNDRDTATLKNGVGTTVDYCSYIGTSRGYVYC